VSGADIAVIAELNVARSAVIIVLESISSRRTKCRNAQAPHANAARAKVDDPDTRGANADALLSVC
jgi:hypothetical protein